MTWYSLPLYDDRYPAPYLSVDIVLLTVEDGVLKVLMVDWYDLADSDLALPHEIAIQHLALEEIAGAHAKRNYGLHGIELDQIGVCSDPDRDQRGRVISIGYMGVVEAGRLREAIEERKGCHLVAVRLKPNSTMATLELGKRWAHAACDHAMIIARAIQALRDRIDTSLTAFRLLPDTFTLLELQRVHEAILGQPLHKLTFRKRMLARRFPGDRTLMKTAKVKEGPHRPAAVYRLA